MTAFDAIVTALALLTVFCLLAGLAGFATSWLRNRRRLMARRVRRVALPDPDPRVHRAGSVELFKAELSRSRSL